jgi:hypothetical protein
MYIVASFTALNALLNMIVICVHPAFAAGGELSVLADPAEAARTKAAAERAEKAAKKGGAKDDAAAAAGAAAAAAAAATIPGGLPMPTEGDFLRLIATRPELVVSALQALGQPVPAPLAAAAAVRTGGVARNPVAAAAAPATPAPAPVGDRAARIAAMKNERPGEAIVATPNAA